MLPARRARRGRDRPSTVPDMGRAVARRLLSRRCAPSTARRASPVGCSKMRLSFGRKWWRDGRLFQKASESARFRPDRAKTVELRRILDQTTAESSEDRGTQTHFGPVDAMGSTIGPVPGGAEGWAAGEASSASASFDWRGHRGASRRRSLLDAAHYLSEERAEGDRPQEKPEGPGLAAEPFKHPINTVQVFR